MNSGSMEKLLLLARCCALSLPGITLPIFHVYVNGVLFNFQVMAVDMSYRLGWIDDSIVKRVRDILQQAKLPTTPPNTMTVEMFKSVMAVR